MSVKSYGQTQETVNGTHPLGVTFSQVFVNGNYVNALAFQCIQINRQD